jgi:cytoskeletal protein RodZ
MYGEPFFSAGSTGGGKLNVGTLSAGAVPVSWLGRPGARLQVKTNLTSGSWQEIAATDGTNLSSGFNSTNGFVSQTNWPASSKAFFRLVKP